MPRTRSLPFLAFLLLTLAGCASSHAICRSGFEPINPPAPTAERHP